ncbi:hypothetical protein THAOC_12910, partial [Thalassiosira oceanica]
EGIAKNLPRNHQKGRKNSAQQAPPLASRSVGGAPADTLTLADTLDELVSPPVEWIDCLNHLGMATGAGDDAASGANHCLGPDEFIDGDIRQLDGYPLRPLPGPASAPSLSLSLAEV